MNTELNLLKADAINLLNIINNRDSDRLSTAD